MRRKVSATLSNERVFQLVDAIYEVATGEGQWASVMRGIAQAADADRVLMFTPSPEAARQLWASHEIEPEMMAGYAEHYVAHDLWTRAVYRLPALGPGTLLVGEALVPPSEFRQSTFFNEFLRPIDIGRFAGVFIEYADGRTHADLTLSLYGGLTHRAFTAEALGLLRAIAPHLQRGLRTYWALHDAGAATARDALDTVSAAVLVCAGNGKVLHANAAAWAMLATAGVVYVRQGVLYARSPGERNVLLAAIRGAASGSAPCAATLALSDARGAVTHAAMVCPVKPDAGSPVAAADPAALVVLRSVTEALGRANDLLRDSFGLTPAELRLVAALQQGLSLTDTAARLGVAHSTARTQLRGILQKTGTKRQAELMKLVVLLQSP